MLPIKKDLIEACKRKERIAQKQLYQQLMPYLNAVCGRYLRVLSNRQDVLQESFVSLFNNINKYDSTKAAFKTWAVRITINACLANNKQQERHLIASELSPDEKGLFSASPSDELNEKELLAFLKGMPAPLFQVFSLNVIDGFSHREIAELLGITKESSRQRLTRAKKWVAERMDALGRRKLDLKKIG